MHKAFTLIELLVVVLIIGILSAIALPQYQRAVAKTRTVEAIAMLKAISDAQEVYYLQNDTYDTTLDQLSITPQKTTKYYRYSCTLNTCWATPLSSNLPSIEFFSLHPTQSVRWKGKHWCIGQTAATEPICKSMGVYDEDEGLGGGHYRIN